MKASEHESKTCRAWGFALLLLAAISGSGLELLHALKVSAYLQNELTRLLLTLAHAHAAAMGLLLLAFAAQGAQLFETRRVGRLLRAGCLLLPMGFALGAIAHPESDPSLGILLAPVGAGCLIVALCACTMRAFAKRH